MPDRTGIFLGWSANLSNFLGLGVEAGASPMYPQKMRVPPLGPSLTGPQVCGVISIIIIIHYKAESLIGELKASPCSLSSRL